MPVPTINLQPGNVTAAVGGTVFLRVGASASDGAALYFQWYRLSNDGTSAALAVGGNYTGVDGTLLRIGNVSAEVAGMYACVVSHPDGQSATSRIAAVLLTGMVLPKISGQPDSVTVAAGAPAQFSISVDSSGDPVAYQWLKNGSPIGGGSVTGATDPDLTISGVTHFAADYYQCRLINSSGTVLSEPAGLTVTDGGTTYPPSGYPPRSGVFGVTPPTDGGTGSVIGGGVWTLNDQPALALGVSGIQRERHTQSEDTLTFVAVARAIDAEPLFAPEQIVSVAGPGGGFFRGRVTQTPATGTGQSESHSYTLSGPWWDLAHLAARQVWKTKTNSGAAGTALSSRVVLGQALDGSRQTTGQTIIALLEYAIGCGAQLSIGQIDPDIFAPLDEVKDVTVADAISQVLRWHPDCVAWFDYTTSPPTLHIRRRANLATRTFALGAGPLSAVNGLTPRTDLRVPAVVIHYEVTGSNNGQATFNLVKDAAPTGATGSEIKALCVTIPLRGVSAQRIEQRVEVRGVRDDLDAYAASEVRDYLRDFVDFLARDKDGNLIATNRVTITAVARGLSSANPQKYDPATGNMVNDDYDNTLNNHLVGGGITDWMIAQCGIKTQEHTIFFSYTIDGVAGDSTLGIRATNAGTDSDAVTTSTYSTVTNYDPGDTVPTGLAASLYASLNVLQYGGSVTLVEQEASGAAGLGCALNLTGGAAAWASMAAMIVSESMDVDTGTSTLTFGPADHLRAADFVELLKIGQPIRGRTDGSPAAIASGRSDVRSGKG